MKANIYIDPRFGGWQMITAGRDSRAVEWVEDIIKRVLEVKYNENQGGWGKR